MTEPYSADGNERGMQHNHFALEALIIQRSRVRSVVMRNAERIALERVVEMLLQAFWLVPDLTQRGQPFASD
jgi:hypothetical protein